MTNGRKRTASFLATLCIASMGGTVLAVSPTFANPEIEDAQEKVDTLFEQAEQASERYNDARIELKQARTRLSALRKDLARQEARLEEVRAEVARSVVDQYQGQALSTATQVMLAEDPDSFIEQLATLDGYQAGVRVLGVEIEKADPPSDVVEAFRDVQVAEQQADAARNKARGEAQQVLAQAQGEAEAFDKVYEQYRLAPEVTRQRLYYETMERVLSKTPKTVVETNNVTPYLPLPEIRARAKQGTQANTVTAQEGQ